MKLTSQYWESYYAESGHFAKVFQDYSDLKSKNRTQEQNVQFRVLSEVIDGKMCL